MISHGFHIWWTDANGNRTEYSVTGCETAREARKTAIRSARRMGWTYPKWWQWWRRDDCRPSLDFTLSN